MTNKITTLLMFGVTLAWGCAQDGSLPDSNDAQPSEETAKYDVSSKEEALRFGGGFGVASCPGGGSPACAACDGGTCVQACYGGFHCDTDSDGTLEVCSPIGSCTAFSGGFGGFGGIIIARRAP